VSWRATEAPGPTETVMAWEAATTLTLRQYRRNSWWVNASVVLPTCLLTVLLLDLEWSEYFVVLLACVIPAVYATVLSYSTGEMLSRPLVADIADALRDDFAFERHGLPVSKRIRVGVPTYTAATGILVATLVGDRHGSDDLVLAVVAALGVGLALSHELSVLLAEGITEPIARVRAALSRVQGGDLTARVPVTTSDELGELAHDFNLMALGLEEREQMRAAFGTYMDKEVAALVLSGQFPEEGVEVDVSILFCDVRGFTSYAESAAATEVIATLNRLFEVIVPIVDRHGGHVDKFIGDGLLAVFGAPEAYPDHADRAVATACAIVAAVNESDTGLTVGVGVNTGRVVAGSIGGAGRLNFSVIGDAVNVAARVEAATRETGDDVLITAATKRLLLNLIPLVSRGTVPLKGKAEPLEVFAPLAHADEGLADSVGR
jgi:adenylate cyclase